MPQKIKLKKLKLKKLFKEQVVTGRIAVCHLHVTHILHVLKQSKSKFNYYLPKLHVMRQVVQNLTVDQQTPLMFG